jgi:hypothetical protein
MNNVLESDGVEQEENTDKRESYEQMNDNKMNKRNKQKFENNE